MVCKMSFTIEEMKEMMLSSWWNMRFWSVQRMTQYRSDKVRELEDNGLLSLPFWPTDIRQIFFKQTVLTDSDTRKIILFFMGNQLCFLTCGRWLISCHLVASWPSWDRRDLVVIKTVHQLYWIYKHAETHALTWTYFDVVTRQVSPIEEYFSDDDFEGIEDLA